MRLSKFKENNLHKFSRDWKPKPKLEVVLSTKIQKIINSDQKLLNYDTLIDIIDFPFYEMSYYSEPVNSTNYPEIKKFIKSSRPFRHKKYCYIVFDKTRNTVSILVKGRVVGVVAANSFASTSLGSRMSFNSYWKPSPNMFLFNSVYEDELYKKLQRILGLKAFL